MYRFRFDIGSPYKFADQPFTLIFFSDERNPAFVGFLTRFLLALGIRLGIIAWLRDHARLESGT